MFWAWGDSGLPGVLWGCQKGLKVSDRLIPFVCGCYRACTFLRVFISGHQQSEHCFLKGGSGLFAQHCQHNATIQEYPGI